MKFEKHLNKINEYRERLKNPKNEGTEWIKHMEEIANSKLDDATIKAITEYLTDFKENSLGIDTGNCLKGCNYCCTDELFGNKRPIMDYHATNLNDFFKKKGIETKLTPQDIAELLQDDCVFCNLGCAIYKARPIACEDFADEPNGIYEDGREHHYCNHIDDKLLINETQKEGFKELEILNIKNQGKQLKDLCSNDLKEISDRIINIAETLSSYLIDHQLKPLNGQELLNLYQELKKSNYVIKERKIKTIY